MEEGLRKTSRWQVELISQVGQCRVKWIQTGLWRNRQARGREYKTGKDATYLEVKRRLRCWNKVGPFIPKFVLLESSFLEPSIEGQIDTLGSCPNQAFSTTPPAHKPNPCLLVRWPCLPAQTVERYNSICPLPIVFLIYPFVMIFHT